MTNTCETCDYTCQTCNGGASTDCTTCDDSNYYLGECLTTCPEGTVEGLTNGVKTCLPCYGTCTSCFGTAFDQCNTCLTTHYFIDNSCIHCCEDGYYPND